MKNNVGEFMEKKKLTFEEINRNFEKLNEAKAIAKLDNKAELSDDNLHLLNARVFGEISHEEMIERLKEIYSNN